MSKMGCKARVMAALLIAILTIKILLDLLVGESNSALVIVWAICCVGFPIVSWIFYIFVGVIMKLYATSQMMYCPECDRVFSGKDGDLCPFCGYKHPYLHVP